MNPSHNPFEVSYRPKGYYSNQRREMVCFIPIDTNKILDIGCGSGEFGEYLKSKRKVEAWGIEICKEVAEEAMAKLDRVLIGDIENDNIQLPPNYFDCIIFNDVLEHLKYPWIVLRKMRDYLKPDGYIVASIPNVRYFNNVKNLLKDKEWTYRDEGILDKTHIRFFTEKGIKDMFNICEYRVVRIEGIRGIEFPWKFRLFNRIMLRAFEDMRYLQFAIVAQKINS